MRPILLACALAALSACNISKLGSCAKDSDCGAASRCDLSQDAPVCVLRPVCPPCDSAHACDANTGTCVGVSAPEVRITAPAAGAAVQGTLAVVVHAVAPGGVSAVEVQAGTAHAAAVRDATDAAQWTASFRLAGVADGPLPLQATATTSAQGAVASERVTVILDQTAPSIALQTDGRATWYGAGQVATVRASITDGSGTGVQPATVVLDLGGHPLATGQAGGGVFTFSVPIDDSVLQAGHAASLAFTIAAADQAGNVTTLANDPREVLQVDRDKPAVSISGITPAGYVAADGNTYLQPAAGPFTLTASITDVSGVDPSSVCLRAPGETGVCAHPGQRSGSNWTFTFPAPQGAQDGTQAAGYAVTARDGLAAQLSGASAAEHQTTTALPLRFDNQGPALTVAQDATIYASREPDGGIDDLTVAAQATDPSGVASARLAINGHDVPAASLQNGLAVFLVDASLAPPGAFNFTVSAQDHLGNTSSAQGSRNTDDAAPSVSLKVFRDSEPAAAGVTYPAAAPNTGYTGSTFLYSDRVHVKGNVTDPAGVASVSLRVDGIDVDGGVATGRAQAVACSGGASCAVDVVLGLNDPGNGVFHTGTAGDSVGGNVIPAGDLSVVLDVADRAVLGDGGVGGNAAEVGNPVRATRFLWQAQLPATVTGLAVHPSGSVIATTDGGTDTVFALQPDAPAVQWSWGGDAGTPAGAIPAAPAVGAGDANGAPIYVASASGTVAAISPSGATLWRADGVGAVGVAPALVETDAGAEQVLLPTADSAAPQVVAVSQGGATTYAAADAADTDSSPVVASGTLFFGTTSGISAHAVGDGRIGAAASFRFPGPFFSLATDGAQLYAASRPTRNGGALLALDLSLQPQTPLRFAASEAPIVEMNGNLLIADSASNDVDEVSGGVATPVFTGANRSFIPLQGSEGHVYLPRATGYLYALTPAHRLSWVFDPPGSILRAATMDCAGRLFVASGNTVYALIGDDRGLADAPWPSWRRDARNTGNAGAPRYGVRTIDRCVQ